MKNEMNTRHQHCGFGGLTYGILVILTGIVLLGVNFGWIGPALKTVVFSWPMILVVIGLFQISHRHFFPAFIMLGVGTFFLLPKIAVAYPQLFPGIGSNFASIYWPMLLIVGGILFILQFIFPAKWHSYHESWEKKWRNHSCGRELNDRSESTYYKGTSTGFEKNVIFGGGEHIFLDEEFTGGEINAIFGGVSLDLRKTKLAEGDNYLEVNAVFGGVTLYVPIDWNVITKFDSVFGGFNDKRVYQEPVDKTRRLIIKGSCVFGGGEIL